MTLSILTVHGDAYSQGKAHGVALAKSIEHNIDTYYRRFTDEIGLTAAEIHTRAERYAAALAADDPDYFAGMQGIAAGAGCELMAIVALNVRYEILYYQRGVNRLAAAADGCTAFAVHPSRAANGHLLIGENWDWIPEIEGAIVHATYPDGLQSLAFTEAGIFGAKIGLNSAGIGLCINGLNSLEDDWEALGRPFHARCYAILRQRDHAAAVAVVDDVPRAFSANFLIAQTPDVAVDVEAAARKTVHLGWQDGFIAHANDFVDPDAAGIAVAADERLVYSCGRRERMGRLLRQYDRPSIDDLQGILRDRYRAPYSICRLPDNPERGPHEQSQTVAGFVIDVTAGEMWVTDGPPDRNPFQHVRLT